MTSDTRTGHQLSCPDACGAKLAPNPVFAFAGAGTGLILTWPLYPGKGAACAVVASSVVWLATARFVLVGAGLMKDRSLVESVGHGQGQEHMLLRGPTQYGTVIAAITMASFKTPTSVVAIGVLCGGDAMAALLGRRFGKHRIPWNKDKVRFKLMFLYTDGRSCEEAACS
jgi:CDP-diglyceride synthetase